MYGRRLAFLSNNARYINFSLTGKHGLIAETSSFRYRQFREKGKFLLYGLWFRSGSFMVGIQALTGLRDRLNPDRVSALNDRTWGEANAVEDLGGVQHYNQVAEICIGQNEI